MGTGRFPLSLRDGVQTASSFSHGSNEAAAAMAAAPVKRANQPSFLLDGLSLGFTLFTLMDQIRREKARFIVAEPCKPLIDWHKELMNQERPDSCTIPASAWNLPRRFKSPARIRKASTPFCPIPRTNA